MAGDTGDVCAFLFPCIADFTPVPGLREAFLANERAQEKKDATQILVSRTEKMQRRFWFCAPKNCIAYFGFAHRKNATQILALRTEKLQRIFWFRAPQKGSADFGLARRKHETHIFLLGTAWSQIGLVPNWEDWSD